MLSLLLSCTANAFYNVAPGDETAHAVKVTNYTIGPLMATNIAKGGATTGYDSLSTFVSEDYRDWESYPNMMDYIYRAYTKYYTGKEQVTEDGQALFKQRLEFAIANNSKSTLLVDPVEVYKDEDGNPLPVQAIKVDAGFHVLVDEDADASFYNVAPGDETQKAHAEKVTNYTIGPLMSTKIARGGNDEGYAPLSDFVSGDYRDWEKYEHMFGYIYRAYRKYYTGLEEVTEDGEALFKQRLDFAIANNSKSTLLVDTVEVYKDEDDYPLPVRGIKVDANFDRPLVK